MLCGQIAEVQRMLDLSREHVATLVEMHAEVSRERDTLRVQLNAANTRISDCLRQAGEDWAKINTLQRISAQNDYLRQECDELRRQISE
ncbi:hypothetical protein AO242_25525 [Pseudomonas sp. ICMP 561]|nr:hypothetical protein AO242_25525 [Pseudomonas sp. ICMP 561]